MNLKYFLIILKIMMACLHSIQSRTVTKTIECESSDKLRRKLSNNKPTMES